jgi:hypothetical protein
LFVYLSYSVGGNRGGHGGNFQSNRLFKDSFLLDPWHKLLNPAMNTSQMNASAATIPLSRPIEISLSNIEGNVVAQGDDQVLSSTNPDEIHLSDSEEEIGKS